jgi:subtilisin family serine protease
MGNSSFRRAVGLVALGALASATAACTRPPGEAATRAFIVGLKSDASPDGLADETTKRHGGRVHGLFHAAMRGYAADLTQGAADELSRDERVAYVEPDIEITTMAQIVPIGIARAGAVANPNLRINSKADGDVDVDVAVVDTGIDLRNPDLNVVPGVDCTSGTCRSGGQDDNGHGTHVSGTIGARDDGIGVVGMAPGARLWPVKALNAKGSGSAARIITALDWVAANSDRIEVVNMSLGGKGTSRALDNAVSNLVAKGVVVVVAAGNSAANSQNDSPAHNPDALTVAAVADYDGKAGGTGGTRVPSGCRAQGPDDRLAGFSNWGAVVGIAAPGVCVVSTKLGGGTVAFSGTSMASPHVAGAAALLASKSKPRNRTDVLALDQTLKSTATRESVASRDGRNYPVLNVSNPSVFAPRMLGGPTGGGGTPTPTPDPDPTPNPTSTTTAPKPGITLAGTGTTFFGWRSARLTWTGATSGTVTVYRNGGAVANVAASAGTYTDFAGFGFGALQYRVCLSGTSTCSGDVPVNFA